MFKLLFTNQAYQDLERLQQNKGLLKRFKAVCKTLAYLETNPKHPSLKTHKYTAIKGANGEEVFEAYSENNIPAAYRIFWHYGPIKNNITVIAITPHSYIKEQ
jgi:hypothetical protein